MYVKNVIHANPIAPKPNIVLSTITLGNNVLLIHIKNKTKGTTLRIAQQNDNDKERPTITYKSCSNTSFLNKNNCKKLINIIPTKTNREFFWTGSISNISLIIFKTLIIIKYIN